jgi:hypothetical protein
LERGAVRRARAERGGEIGPSSWRITQLLKAVEPIVESVVAEQATTYWNRAAHRAVDRLPGHTTVAWRIEGVEVVALTAGRTGPARVAAQDIGLLQPLRHRLRGQRAVIDAPVLTDERHTRRAGPVDGRR